MAHASEYVPDCYPQLSTPVGTAQHLGPAGPSINLGCDAIKGSFFSGIVGPLAQQALSQPRASGGEMIAREFLQQAGISTATLQHPQQPLALVDLVSIESHQ